MNSGFVEVLVREREWSLFYTPRLCVSIFELKPQRICLYPNGTPGRRSSPTTTVVRPEGEKFRRNRKSCFVDLGDPLK